MFTNVKNSLVLFTAGAEFVSVPQKKVVKFILNFKNQSF